MRFKVTFVRHGGTDELAFDTRWDAETFADWLCRARAGIDPEIAEGEGEDALKQFNGSAVSRHRKRRGLTQSKLAAMAGIPLDTLREYERNKYAPSVERLVMLARSLRVSIDDLFEDDPQAGVPNRLETDTA